MYKRIFMRPEKMHVFYSIVLLISMISGLASSIAEANNAMYLWREPVSIVRKGGGFSVIQDDGRLLKAIKASNNKYLFSEKGMGTKALVLIGTPVQVMHYFAKNASTGIDNRLKDLPEVYMGITKYVPAERFTGLFPLEDFFSQFVKQIALDYLPVNTGFDSLNDMLDAMANAQGLKEQLDWIAEQEIDDSQYNQLLYVKFTYMPEDGTFLVGKGKVSFSMIEDVFVQRLPWIKASAPKLVLPRVRKLPNKIQPKDG